MTCSSPAGACGSPATTWTTASSAQAIRATPASASCPTKSMAGAGGAMMAGNNRPRVVYLGGLGRSGTTLLERLLGELPGVCSVGEVVHLWQRGIAEAERCGCGEPLPGCPFWRKVGEIAFGGWAHADMP